MAARLTPSSYIEAPIRSAALPNKSGTQAIYLQSSYSFDNHASKTELRVIDLHSLAVTVLLTDHSIGDPTWLAGDEEIAWLKNRHDGDCDLIVADVGDISKRYCVATFPGSLSYLKVKPLNHGAIAFAAVGKRDRDGLYRPKKNDQSLSRARYYTSNQVRQYDSWVVRERDTIFYALLEHQETSDKYTASILQSAFVGHPELECLASKSSFDITQNGIAFAARDPHLDPSLHTMCNLYYLQITDWKHEPRSLEVIDVPGLTGAASNPTFSPNGDTIGLLKMPDDGKESGQNHIILVEGVSTGTFEVHELLGPSNGNGTWHLCPDALWFQDDNTILFMVMKEARTVFYRFPIDRTAKDVLPTQITYIGSTSYMAPLGDRSFLLTGSSLIDNSFFAVLDDSCHLKIISSLSEHGRAHGLSQNQITELHWIGDDNYKIHGRIMKPSNFHPTERYPVCFLIHGGPQWAALDAWENDLNEAQIYAEAGYVVVIPNVTGSKGYGQSFMDRINGNWGGSPYIDLEKCFEHVERELTYADTDRAVIGGVSWGGFMTNYIQGHELGRKFRAIFTICGLYSTLSFIATDELFFPKEAFEGLPWESDEARKAWTVWDPSNFTHNWATPQLIVHGEQDYRVSIDHALAAFNTLQARGVDSALLCFEDEAHMVMSPENKLVLYNTILNFINKKVGLPAVAEETAAVR